MTGKAGSLGNYTGATRVGSFGGRLWYSCVYPKFDHLMNTLIGGMAKVLVNKLSIEAAAHSCDSC